MRTTFKVLILCLSVILFMSNSHMNNCKAQTCEKATELFSAIKDGELEKVNSLIKKDKNLLNAVNPQGQSALISAVDEGKTEIAQILIKKGANLELSSRGMKAIHFAALRNNLELIKALDYAGANLKAKTSTGSQAYHLAVRTGNKEILKYLAGKEIDVTEATPGNREMTLFASMGGNIDIFKFYEKKGVDINAIDIDGDNALHWAASGSNPNMVDYLINERGFDIDFKNKKGAVPFQTAVEFGQMEIVKYFMDNGFDINTKNNEGGNWIHTAAGRDHKDLVKFFLEKNLNPNLTDENGRTPILLASWSNNTDLVKLLLEKGAKVNPKECIKEACNVTNGSPLHNSVWRSPEIVKLLLKKGANVKTLNENGQTALHRAATSGNMASVKLLLEAGSDINHQDKDGMSPLHIATQYGRHEVINHLLKNNAKLNITNKKAQTPLHTASIAGNHEAVAKMIDKNANIELKDNLGNTPLSCAFYHMNKKTAKTLIAVGASKEGIVKDNCIKKDLNHGEAVVWYLNHSGWAVKTKNNLLIFDYWHPDQTLDIKNLNNGYINPEQLEDSKVIVFVSHSHGDHYDPEIWEWQDKIKDITYVFGYEIGDGHEYTYVKPRKPQTIKDIKINPVVSTDSGEAFLVEVDGLTIYHSGDHANFDRDNPIEHHREIDYLAQCCDHVDLAFLPITGCRFQDKVALKQGVNYTIKKMKPEVVFLQHGGYSDQAFNEFENESGSKDKTQFKYSVTKGERFHYPGKQLSLNLKD